MPRKIPLPRAWNRRTKAAILHILALSHYAFTAMLARAMNERRREYNQDELLNGEIFYPSIGAGQFLLANT